MIPILANSKDGYILLLNSGKIILSGLTELIGF